MYFWLLQSLKLKWVNSNCLIIANLVNICNSLHCISSCKFCFKSRAIRAKINSRDCSVQVGSESIKQVDLGAHLDAELTMKRRVTTVAASCFYYLCCLHQTHSRIGTEVTMLLMLRMTPSYPDYCNSFLL